MVAWWTLLLAFAWLWLFRARRKRHAARVNASIGAGGTRDLAGRGGF